MKKIDKKEWLNKYNLDYKLYFSNPKNDFNKFKINLSKSKSNLIMYGNDLQILINEYIKTKNNNEFDLNIDSLIFKDLTGFTKFDYILKYYFNQFNINQFSKILFIRNFKFVIKDKIQFFYNIQDTHSKDIYSIKNKYDLISIFTHNFKFSNRIKNINSIIYDFLNILLVFLKNKIINNDTILTFSIIPSFENVYLDLLILLEFFFNVTFFSEYKIQDINKQTIEIILSNGRNFTKLEKYIKKILTIKNFKYGFLNYSKPEKSCIFLFIKINTFLIERFIYFYKLSDVNISKLYTKIILKNIFTSNIPNNNALQIPYFINLLRNKENQFKIGNIIYNFIIKNEIQYILSFSLSYGYYNIFILLALQKLKKKNGKTLISIDKNQKKIFKNQGLILINKLNLQKYLYFIDESFDTYIPKLIQEKKKLQLILLGITYYNFSILNLEFNFSLKLASKNTFIAIIRINEPGINKLINYITNNCDFLEEYYKNFFLVIYKISDFKKLKDYVFYNVSYSRLFIDF